MSLRLVTAESAHFADVTPKGSSGGASRRFKKKLAAEGFTVSEGFSLKPGFLYTQVRGISARVNQNYDGWPSYELKQAYKTFLGKPCFVNHTNERPVTARGVVVASRYVENGNDKYIDVIQEIDAQRYPKLAHEIITGGLDSVSMGAEAGFTICSYCGNRAVEEEDLCSHVTLHKGEMLPRFNKRTGKHENVLVYESCHKLNFFELSYVFDPADETAVASKVLVASRKTAKCHYCDNEAEEGFNSCPSHRAMENNKFKAAVLAAMDCPPGVDCGDKDPDSPFAFNPATWGGGTSGGSPASAATPGGPSSGPVNKKDWMQGDAKEMAHTKGLYNDLMKTFPGADIGTYRVDDFHEHDHGAMDFMTSDPAQAAQVRQMAFDAGSPYVLWQQQQWNSDGSVSGMDDRHSPTQNHMDHVHIAPIPVPAQPTVQAEPHRTTTTQPTQRAASFEERVLKTAGDFEDYKAWEDDLLRKREDDPNYGKGPRGMPNAPHSPAHQRWLDRMDKRMPLGSFEDRVLRLAWGEISAPMKVDTLRPEGDTSSENETSPDDTDDTDEFPSYVNSPGELRMPDLSQAAQLDREQDAEEQPPMDQPPVQQNPAQQYMTLQIPIPLPQEPAPQLPMTPQPVQTATPLQGPVPGQMPGGGALPPAAGGIPPQPPAPQQQMAASFERRVLQTLQKTAAVSTTDRTPTKGRTDMSRSTLAERGKVASRGRRQHQAGGPLVDTGDQSRNDQGEQEEAFLSQTPPADSTSLPDDDTHNISNSESNLVAKVQRGREQLLKDAQALAALHANKRTAGVDGDADKVVNPTVPHGEELTGDDFQSLEENPTPSTMTASTEETSLRAFQAFDKWLADATGRPSKYHTEATIKRAAEEFTKRAGVNPQIMFPALGIVLREARKNEKAAKEAAMQKDADQKMEVAAPDERIDVETPVKGDTDAQAQASQFDPGDFDHIAGKGLEKPDTSTDSQFWAPGEGNKGTKRKKPTGSVEKTAGALLGMRCAEAMIAAGLEPNDRERRYQLAAEYQNMNRDIVANYTALAERFAAVLEAMQEQYKKVASGTTRGAARSPIPPGLTQGVAARTASMRTAANDPTNDSLLFG